MLYKGKNYEINEKYAKDIDKKVLPYIPKTLLPHLVWADIFKGDGYNGNEVNYYCIAFEFDDGQEVQHNCIGVADIKWYCSEVLKGRREF